MKLPAISIPTNGVTTALRAAAPTGMVVVGCIGVIGGVVLACNATMKCDAILEELQEDIDKVNHVRDIATEEKYTKNDYQHDLTIAYAKGGAKLVKLYLPAALVIIGSLALILGGHKLLLNRYTAGMAAYELLQSGYDNYRERVREDYGEDVDRKYAYGLDEEVVGITEEGEDGKVHKKKVKVKTVNKSNGLSSPRAFFWDKDCNGWEGNPYYNEVFLLGRQAEYNRELARVYKLGGVVTLAYIKQDLGSFPINPMDYKYCWRWDPNGGENQIDLGILSAKNADAATGADPEMVYILEPNVQGTIDQLLPSPFKKKLPAVAD